MGKIADALNKYAHERRTSRTAGLTRADLNVLLSYDRKTCHLLNTDTANGQINNQSAEALRNKGTIQRLLANKLIYPGGKLTAKGLRECEGLQKELKSEPRPASAGTENQKTDRASSVRPSDVEVAPDKDRTPLKAALPETRHLREVKPETHRLRQVKKEEGSKAGASASGKPPEQKTKRSLPTTQRPADTADVKNAAKPKEDKRAAAPIESAPGASQRESGQDHPQAAEQPGPDKRRALDRNLISLLEPRSYEAEQFKILRTGILFPIAGEVPKSILVTSALPGEGKTFVAANLAVSIALNINRHVLLMDCDIRKPDIHRQFGLGKVPGLNEYLMQKSELGSLLVRTDIDRLTILPGGEPSQSPSELMSSERMTELIEEVKHRYYDRLIVIDSPPTNLAAETGFLARQVDGILVVAKYGKTPRKDIADLLELLGSDKILGVVLNRVDMALKRKYGYKYSGKYRGYYK